MDKRNIDVTVIVPLYVDSHQLKKNVIKCLDSLVYQTIANIEILVIDDCSPEDLSDLETKYAAFSSIHWFRLSENKGPGGARNYAMELAAGKYIGFCDFDDWVDIHYYKKCFQMMEESGADIGMCTQLRHYDFEPEESVYKCKYNEFFQISGDVALRIMTKEYDLGVKIIPPCVNKIYRKDYLITEKLYFPEKLFWEDHYFSFVTMLNANRVIGIPEVVYHHYRRMGSIVQSFSQQHIDDFMTIHLNIRQYIEKHGCYEQYQYNFHQYCEQYYNLIVREIFEFVQDEETRKKYLSYSFRRFLDIINIDDFLKSASSETLRRHIQPHLKDTKIL